MVLLAWPIKIWRVIHAHIKDHCVDHRSILLVGSCHSVEFYPAVLYWDGHFADSMRLPNGIVSKVSNSSHTTSPSIVISVDLDVCSSQTLRRSERLGDTILSITWPRILHAEWPLWGRILGAIQRYLPRIWKWERPWLLSRLWTPASSTDDTACVQGRWSRRQDTDMGVLMLMVCSRTHSKLLLFMCIGNRRL